MGYLMNFMVYTLAMIGVIAIALLVFKNSNSFGGSGKSKCMKVIDTLNLGPRKTLYIVSAGRENFLIAGDVDKTSLISKLETSHGTEEDSSTRCEIEKPALDTFKETMANLPKSKYMDKQDIGIKTSLLRHNGSTSFEPVMKNLASRIKD